MQQQPDPWNSTASGKALIAKGIVSLNWLILKTYKFYKGSIAFPLLGAGTGGIDPMTSKRLLFDEISSSSYEGLVLIVIYS